MSGAVVPFQFHQQPVRVITRNGEPWFVCSDIADALGYRDASNAARNLADHQRGTQIVSTPSGDQTVTIINESGLYRLVLRSRKPEAIAFSDWVTGEVLPAIRKTGSYGADRSAEFRTQAHAAGLAVEREVFATLMSGEPSPKVMAWLTTDRTGAPAADAKSVDPRSFAVTWPQLVERMADGELTAGATTAELIELAQACMARVRQRERSRVTAIAAGRAA